MAKTASDFSMFQPNLEKKDFSEIVSRIENVIFQQKFERAATGFYNPSIIAKDLGLSDKKQVDISGRVESVNLTPEEAKNISDALDAEV